MTVDLTDGNVTYSGPDMLRTPEGGAPGTAHEGRGESRELNDSHYSWKRVPHMHVVRRVNEII